MISLTIGLVIFAASMQVYLSASRGSRVSQIDTELNDEGIAALNLIQQQLKQAGYSTQIIPAGPNAVVVGNYAGLAVFGCDHGFANLGADFDNLSCKSGSSGASALAIRYEATLDNTYPTREDPRRPTNCIGNGIDYVQPSSVLPEPTPKPEPYALADNRYFINVDSAVSSLSCRGVQGSGASESSQPLIPEVEDMVIRYGVASRGSLQLASEYDLERHQIIDYLTASEVSALPSAPAAIPPGASDRENRWSRVLSIRVCVVMRSRDPVPDTPEGGFTYRDCDNASVTGTDNYLRRAFTTTVLLRNRLVMPY